jgi:site-specific recombinase XerD
VLGYQLRAFGRWLEEKRCPHPEELQTKLLERWIRHLRQKKSLRGGLLKPSSVNKAIVGAKTLLDWLQREGKVGAVVASALVCIKEPRLLPQSVLTHAQMQRLLAAGATDSPGGLRDRAMWELLYSSGIRVAELLGLELADVDLHAASAIVTGKGDKQRVVPFGKTAGRFLACYIQGVRPGLLLAPDEPALWLARDGRKVSYAACRRRLAAHASVLKLPFPVTPHTFRRSCTTELVRSGANLWHVKELLGHENLDTLQHYIRLTITDLKKTHARCHPRERDAKFEGE